MEISEGPWTSVKISEDQRMQMNIHDFSEISEDECMISEDQ